jgi:hypothetical protein
MIDIPIGKALVPVEGDGSCGECVIKKQVFGCRGLACYKNDRRDGVQALFKLVDYPQMKNNDRSGY